MAKRELRIKRNEEIRRANKARLAKIAATGKKFFLATVVMSPKGK